MSTFRLAIVLAIVTCELALFAENACCGGPAKFLIETVAGSGQSGDFAKSTPAATSATSNALKLPVDQPFGVETGPDGALYITSIGQHRVLRLDQKQGVLTSVAGTGALGHSGDGGPATEARLNEPYEVRFTPDGHYMYFVEMKNHLIRRVDLHTGIISTVSGAPQEGFAGDGGPATEARFKQPHSIALDDKGFLYVADIGNHRIRRIDTNLATISTIAGTGEKKLPRDGEPAQGQPILGPRALAIVGRTMWIALREGNSVWRLDLDSGRIHHVAGSGASGFSGDGGPPTLATFNGPKGIAATAEGIVYVVDSENQVIRRLDSKTNQLATIAGSGPKARGFAGEHVDALEAKFDRPHGVGLGTDGSIFIGDTNNHRVRVLRPVGETAK